MTTSIRMVLGVALLGLAGFSAPAHAAGGAGGASGAPIAGVAGPPVGTPPPPGITVKAPAVYPEGVAYNEKTGEFFVGSMRKGVIGAFKADGKYREFARDPLLVSSVGLHADPERGRLLACVSDPGVSIKTSPKTYRKVARLMSFDLKSGRRLKTVDLQGLAAGDHFCNDLAIDGDGNVYVTDSFVPFIYKVDPAFKASVFMRNDLFQGDGFNLNGIVHHKDGYLIVAKSSDGSLWKLDEKAIGRIEDIKLSEPLPNADGLILTTGGDLIVIQNGDRHRVARVKSTDGWKTAKVDKAVTLEAAFPTTGVQAGDKIYVLMARLGDLFANPKAAKADTFTLTEVSFP